MLREGRECTPIGKLGSLLSGIKEMADDFSWAQSFSQGLFHGIENASSPLPGSFDFLDQTGRPPKHLVNRLPAVKCKQQLVPAHPPGLWLKPATCRHKDGR